VRSKRTCKMALVPLKAAVLIRRVSNLSVEVINEEKDVHLSVPPGEVEDSPTLTQDHKFRALKEGEK
jgi:hypothetical protein